MVTKRFLAVFYPAAEFLVTTRITRVEGEPFKTEGKVMINAGWLAVYGKEAQTDDTPTLAPVQPNETVQTTNVEVIATQTKPPPRFTEATLLGAMEGAGKLVEDEELREAMREKGLGTPATRAQIIEGLIYEKYVLRQGRDLQPTAKAFSLIALLRGLEIPELSSPELTGDWEFKLRSMARGQMKRPDFMQEIADMTREIVAKAKRHESDTVPGDFGTLKVPCPKCGGEIHENYKKFQCQKCDFSLWKIVAGRQLEIPEVEELIAKRQVGPLQGFRSKAGQALRRGHQADAGAEAGVRFRPGPDWRRTARRRRLISPARSRWASARKCGGARVRDADALHLREGRRGQPHVRFPVGQDHPAAAHRARADAEAARRPARPICWRSSSPRRAGPSRPSWWSRTAAWALSSSRARRRPERRAAKAGEPAAPEPKIDFTGQQPLGKCPKCGKRVFEGEAAYVCEQSQADKKPCKFKINKVILQQPIDRDQAARLLAKGKTDLFHEFISAKTGRPFPAYLVMDDAGKVTFDFPPRGAEVGGDDSAATGRVMADRARSPSSRRPNDKWIKKFLQHLATDRGASAYTQRNYRQAMLRVSSLAPGRAAAAARVGDNCSGMISAPTCVPGAAQSEPGGHPAPLLRLADLLPVPRSPWRGGGFAHQEPRPAQARQAAAQIPDAAADGRFAGRPAQAPAGAGRQRTPTAAAAAFVCRRDVAVLETIYSCGLRISELCGLGRPGH